MSTDTSVSHFADGAVLGFYFQSLYARYEILDQPHDDASICLERFYDIEVLANGQPSLVHLKHSITRRLASVTLASRPFWETLKAWIDVLPKVELAETRLQLVTVTPLDKESALAVLLDDKTDRFGLHDELVKEAQRVVNEHQAAIRADKTPLHRAERVSDCAAFLRLEASTRTAFLAALNRYFENALVSRIRVAIQPSLRT